MIQINGIDPRMIANNIEPSKPIHPGALLKDEIEYRGISQKKLAESMGMSCSVLNEVLNCKRSVTTEYALLFEAALGIEAGMWIRIQADYNLQTAKQNKSFAERLANIQKVASVL
jgi:addiction module antidote protein, HigA family